MIAPTGEQYELAGGGYRCVVTEGGATLRLLEHAGRPLVDGFAEDAMPTGGRGQLLMPWPNRIRDGRYDFAGTEHRLGLSEPARANASHGLVRWVSWRPVSHTADTLVMSYRLMAQSGYPWTLDLQVRYAVDAAGLTVTQSATNRASGPAPYAAGAHPYLRAGDGPVDDWRLTLPAETQVLADPDRLLPTGAEPVAGTDYDFSGTGRIGAVSFDSGFTELIRTPEGRVEVRVESDSHAVVLWGDRSVRWLQVYSADDAAAPLRRRALAVEPMSAPADAFRSGDGLTVLEPGDTHELTWGIAVG